jgi:cobalt-zinc-cadmium resistance protein CzcA
MPPNVSDNFIILKPKSEWPDPKMSKEAFVEKLNGAVSQLPGNSTE